MVPYTSNICLLTATAENTLIHNLNQLANFIYTNINPFVSGKNQPSDVTIRFLMCNDRC